MKYIITITLNNEKTTEYNVFTYIEKDSCLTLVITENYSRVIPFSSILYYDIRPFVPTRR